MMNCKHCQRLINVLADYRKTLEWYAERKHYKIDFDLDVEKIMIDKGYKANRTLDAK